MTSVLETPWQFMSCGPPGARAALPLSRLACQQKVTRAAQITRALSPCLFLTHTNLWKHTHAALSIARSHNSTSQRSLPRPLHHKHEYSPTQRLHVCITSPSLLPSFLPPPSLHTRPQKKSFHHDFRVADQGSVDVTLN